MNSTFSFVRIVAEIINIDKKYTDRDDANSWDEEDLNGFVG